MEELALRLTPSMIEDIRRRRQEKIEAQKIGLDNIIPGVIDLGEIKEDS
jgi:hypothetical protein